MTTLLRWRASRGATLAVVLTFSALASVTGCAGLRIPTTPVETVVDLAPGNAPNAERVLIVFLPGASDTPADLVQQGFVQQVRQRGIKADVVLADLHVGYYVGRTAEERLRTDIMVPARAKGYRQVWLAGISLGGFGSLLYAQRHEGSVDGIIALAPYIASNSVLAEVSAAGGLRGWNVPIKDGDFERELLRWLKGYGDATQKRPTLYLGYGTEDGFAQTNAAVGALLPSSHMRSTPGGHDWGPWQKLWGEFLDVAPLPR
jgi:pimeloyl-ACP methyl ester carboxylesterase